MKEHYRMVVFDITMSVTVFGWSLFIDVQVVRKDGLFVGLGFWTEKADVL